MKQTPSGMYPQVVELQFLEFVAFFFLKKKDFHTDFHSVCTSLHPH